MTLALISLSACTHRDPDATYEHVKDTYRKGNPVGAEKEATEAYNEFKNLSSEWAWKFLILKANALHAQGRNDEALTLLASREAPPSSGELEVRLLRAESVANSAAGHAELADSELKHAQELCTSVQYPACADVFSVRGYYEMKLSHFKTAQQSFERALELARSSGDRFLQTDSLLNLSWTADEQTNFDQALDWAAAAREIAEREHFADARQTAIGNMGWAYYKLGDREKARGMLIEAENEAGRLNDTSDQLSWLLDAGYTYMDDNNFSVAEQSFEKSLQLARKMKSRDDITTCLQALAFISEATGKLGDAARYADEVLSTADNNRDKTYPRLVQGRIAARQHDPATAEAAFHEVENSPDSPVFLKWEAEHGLARLYEDENQPDKAASEYRTALNTFESARSELQHENSRLPFLTNATRIYDDYIHLLIAQGKTDEALQVAEFSRARTLSEGLGILKKGTSFQPDALNARQIARTSGGNILFYWLGEKQSYLWLITSQKSSLFPLPPAPEIDAAVQRYRKALLGPQDVLESSNNEGFALYRMLIEPAKSLLPKNAKLFIIPDGTLNTLNFETLLVPDPTPHYWIEDVTVSDASSLHLLAASQKASKPQESLLLLGNAVVANPDYPELRKAAAEMDSIEKHFPKAENHAFSREQATPVAYLSSKPEQFSYIHFVAHGTASRMSPLDSAIVLSKATTEDDSFKLYARDIIQHPLRAKLVTISTCYGAGSRAYSGEGLVGLSWAFLRAGAHNVIGALWEVSDVSTPQLMDDLYAGLKKGQSPDSALRAAKLSLLHSGTAFRKPFYWAPFQLYTRS